MSYTCIMWGTDCERDLYTQDDTSYILITTCIPCAMWDCGSMWPMYMDDISFIMCTTKRQDTALLYKL